MTSAILEPILGPSAGWLVEAAATVVKATVLLLVAMGIARLLRSRSAALRHLVWTATLAAALVLPALHLGVPEQLRMPAVTLPAEWVAAETAVEGDAAPGLAHAEAPEAGASGAEGGTEGAVPASAATARGPGGGSAGWRSTAGWVALLLWALGAAWVLVRTTWAAVRLARVRERADPLTHPKWRRRAREASEALGGPERPPIRVSPEISVPVTCGFLQPTLLLPQEAVDEWSPARTEAVLVHELGHVLRRDTATHVLGRLACAAYWFHPLVWKAAREAAKERERACDDIVLHAGARASEYARHLVEIARRAAPRALPGAASVSMARRADLEGRVLAVLEDDADRSPVSRGWAAAALLPTLALALGLGALSFEAGTSGTAGATDDAGAAERAALLAADSAQEASTGEEGEELAASLLDLLDDPDPDVRAAAADAVGKRRIADALPALIASLEDDALPVRVAAARALGKIEDPAAVDALGRALADGEDLRFRKTAAWALGETESPEAVAALRRALDAVEERRVRKRIVKALGETRHPAAVPALEATLEASEPWMRRTALEALVENDSEEAQGALARALRSDDARLRATAARALGERDD